MLKPDAVGLDVEMVENVPFLSDQENQNISDNNASQFLELGEEEIARHHER